MLGYPAGSPSPVGDAERKAHATRTDSPVPYGGRPGVQRWIHHLWRLRSKGSTYPKSPILRAG